MIRRIVLLLCMVLPVSACAPVISQKTMNTVDKAISFPALQQNPDAFKGRTVLLGGQIITTTVKADETWIEVLEKPLNYRGKPSDADQSSGRFLVRMKGFLDPAIYSSGRRLTVAGQVDGRVVRLLREVNYTYPLLTAKEYYLWKQDDSYGYPQFGVGVGGGVWRGGSGGGVGVGVGF